MDSLRPSAYGGRQVVGIPITGSSAHRSTGAAASNAATVAFAADTQRGYVVGMVLWSYSGAAATGRLTIESGSSTIFDIDVSTGGQIEFSPPLLCGKSEAVTVTLGGVAAVTGKVNVHIWKME